MGQIEILSDIISAVKNLQLSVKKIVTSCPTYFLTHEADDHDCILTSMPSY